MITFKMAVITLHILVSLGMIVYALTKTKLPLKWYHKLGLVLLAPALFPLACIGALLNATASEASGFLALGFLYLILVMSTHAWI